MRLWGGAKDWSQQPAANSEHKRNNILRIRFITKSKRNHEQKYLFNRKFNRCWTERSGKSSIFDEKIRGCDQLLHKSNRKFWLFGMKVWLGMGCSQWLSINWVESWGANWSSAKWTVVQLKQVLLDGNALENWIILETVNHEPDAINMPLGGSFDARGYLISFT